MMSGARLTILVTVLGLLVATGAHAQRGQVAANQAVVTSKHGDVQTRHGTGGYLPAKLNEVLAPGDGIKTGANSRAELSVGQGGYVRMDASSQILVTSLSSSGVTSFQAIVGGVWVTIERALAGASKFEVRMPSAVASVTGTVFRCEVDEDGESETWVYEGAVDVSAGEQHVRVEPDERCLVPPDLRAVVERFNLQGDDEAAWVMYNRHRDIVSHLGDPQIIVVLREEGLSEQGSFLASQELASQLALHGLHSTSVLESGVTDFSFNPDGTINWRRKPNTDYAVIGDINLVQVRPVGDRLYSVRIAADVRLVRNGERDPLTSIQVTLPGAGSTTGQAVRSALEALGRRVGAGLAPRIIRELMQEQAGLVRVDLTGADREQLGRVMRVIRHLDGVLRAAPLVLPGDRVSLAVVTAMSAEELGAALGEVAADAVEVMLAGDRVLYLRFLAPPGTGEAPAPGAMLPRRPLQQQPAAGGRAID